MRIQVGGIGFVDIGTRIELRNGRTVVVSDVRLLADVPEGGLVIDPPTGFVVRPSDCVAPDDDRSGEQFPLVVFVEPH